MCDPYIQEYYRSVKQFVSRSGLTACQAKSGFKLFAKIINGLQKWALVSKELTSYLLFQVLPRCYQELCVHLYVLGNSGYRLHCGHYQDQPVQHGIRHCGLLFHVVRTRVPHQATQETCQSVSFFICLGNLCFIFLIRSLLL